MDEIVALSAHLGHVPGGHVRGQALAVAASNLAPWDEAQNRNKVAIFVLGMRFTRVTSSRSLCYARTGMQAAERSSFQPAAAGALLASATGAGIGAGALIGWAFSSIGIGILGGAVAGVPAGIYAVYRRYRGFFT